MPAFTHILTSMVHPSRHTCSIGPHRQFFWTCRKKHHTVSCNFIITSDKRAIKVIIFQMQGSFHLRLFATKLDVSVTKRKIYLHLTGKFIRPGCAGPCSREDRTMWGTDETREEVNYKDALHLIKCSEELMCSTKIHLDMHTEVFCGCRGCLAPKNLIIFNVSIKSEYYVLELPISNIRQNTFQKKKTMFRAATLLVVCIFCPALVTPLRVMSYNLYGWNALVQNPWKVLPRHLGTAYALQALIPYLFY